MEGTNHISQAQLKPFHDKVHAQADGIVRYFILGYFIFGVFLSVFYASWGFGLAMGSISLGIFYFVRSFYSGTVFFRIIVSLLLWNFPLQFMFQMQGMYEMFFFYFVSLTVLLVYEDWKAILPAAVYAMITLIVLSYIQINDLGFQRYLVNKPLFTYTSMSFHLGIIVFYAGLCMAWTKVQRRQTEEAAINWLNMEEQLQLMETNIRFANRISQGDLNTAYEAEKADKLGESLMNMRDSLVQAAEREARERFVNAGLASISEILRNHSDNLTELCDKVIEKLVGYMKANQGGIFIIRKDDASGDDYLELMACRAYERKKFLEKRIEIGQGLVGQAAYERETIYLLELPEDYINITSGLGLATPKSLLIVPLKSNDELVGVIEMASFQEFSETDMEFLEKVGESIASTVISAQTNQTTKELLEQSRQMTEEMQAQEEEMRQNMEEMQATQEELARKQAEFAEKEANLSALVNNTTDSIVAIDNHYKVVVMNDAVKKRYKGTQYDGMFEGSNALDMLGDVRDEWKAYYDRAMTGEKLNFVLKSSVNGEDSWREYSINPIYDKAGQIIGVSIFSRDITEKHKTETSLRERSFILDAMMNTLAEPYYALDNEYKIIVANEASNKLFNHAVFKRGTNVLELLKEKEIWQDRFDRALNGETIEFSEALSGDTKGNVCCRPVKNEDNEVVGVSVTVK